jgi:glycogen operon protein
MDPPVVEMISEEGLLRDTKLIAEPWDAAGLYQVGGFPGRRWSEWNGKYRDDVRRFWRGEPGMTADLATRLCGSADLYEHTGRLPQHSINFITCHDGFTLNDLVSYSHKHNRANGEGNRDGTNDNHSWNCGVEGPTSQRAVLELRRRQVRNLMATLMLSQGVPMILGGDEFLRTQGGNNNGWCQDNEMSWHDWGLADDNAGFLRFTRAMIALRRRHSALRRRRFFHGRWTRWYHAPDVAWHGIEPGRPDFSSQSRSLALTIDGRQTGREEDEDLYIAFNAWEKPLTFVVPGSPNGRAWRRVVDTSQPPPEDFIEEGTGPVVAALEEYRAAPFSLVVLITEGT